MAPHVLLFSDDDRFLETNAELIAGFGYTSDRVRASKDAAEKLQTERFHVLLADLNMGSAGSFVLQRGKQYPDMMVLAASKDRRPERIIKYFRQYRIFDYLIEPYGAEALRSALDRACEMLMLRNMKVGVQDYEDRLKRTFLDALDWKRELRLRHVDSIAEHLMHQVNIGFFHGSGFGALITAASMLVKKARRNEETGMIESKPAVFELLKENLEQSSLMAECFSLAQKILAEKNPSLPVVPASRIIQILGELEIDLAPFLRNKDQKIVLGEFPTDMRPMRLNDAWMRIVFEELLINAMKYSSDNDRINVIFFNRGNHVEIKILNPADTIAGGSAGLSGVDEHRIFEPFYRLSPIMDDRYSGERLGFGMGLAVVRKIVQLHEGNIFIYTVDNFVRTEGGRDICVTIRLPLETAPEERRQEVQEIETGTPS